MVATGASGTCVFDGGPAPAQVSTNIQTLTGPLIGPQRGCDGIAVLVPVGFTVGFNCKIIDAAVQIVQNKGVDTAPFGNLFITKEPVMVADRFFFSLPEDLNSGTASCGLNGFPANGTGERFCDSYNAISIRIPDSVSIMVITPFQIGGGGEFRATEKDRFTIIGNGESGKIQTGQGSGIISVCIF